MSNLLQCIGYYIVEKSIKPEWMDIPCKEILNVSSCICNIYPNVWEGKENEISYLFENKRLDVDGRFTNLADAKDIFNKYLYKVNNLKIVGICTSKENIEQLKNDENFGINAPVSNENIEGKNIGCDILGADNGNFHSYLCNDLEKEIKKKYKVLFTENGLIANEYKEVEKMAKYIKELGEPVDWLPYILYEYTESINHSK